MMVDIPVIWRNIVRYISRIFYVKRVHAHVSTDTHVTINNESVDEISALRSELHEARLEIEGLRNEMNTRDETLAALRVELNTANENLSAANESLTAIGTLEEALKVQTTKAKRFWSQKCEQLLS